MARTHPFLSVDLRARERGASGSAGTRPTPSASVAAAAASTCRRAVAAHAVTLSLASANEFGSAYNWSVKTIKRKTTGIGRMQHLRHLPHRFKSSFREGTQSAPRKKVTAVA